MSSRRVDAVILDLGNVLVFHDNALLVRRLADRAGTVPDVLEEALRGKFAEMVNRGELPPEELHRTVCELLGAKIPMADFVTLWSSHFTVHDAVMPTVEALAQQVPLVLLSNTNALHWEWVRPRIPVLERFRAHVLSHEVALVKPQAAIYQRALQAAGVEPDRAAFFDDIQLYVDAACELGIHGRLFTDAPTFKRQLSELGLPT